MAPSLVPPAFRSTPAYTETDGPTVADVCRLAGFAPDPEQELVLDDLFAVDASGAALTLETAIICARQNLKTGLLKQAALGWLFVTQQRLIVWSAHEFRTAQEAFRDMDELVHAHPSLAARVKAVHRGNGDEAIELHSGARLIFKARTKGGGRGLSGDKVVLDEAFALKPAHMGALLPTLSARPDPQVVYASSAGLVESEVLRSIRDRGRSGADPSLAYLEWADPNPGGCQVEDCDHRITNPGCVLDDVDRWKMANPALGRRITVEYIAAERRALPPDEFARERLGWWDEPGEVENGLSVDAWKSLTDEAAKVADPVVIGLDVAPGHAAASIVGFGGGVLELFKRRAGASWLVGECVKYREAFGEPLAWAYDPAGPIGSLVPDFIEAGIELTPVEGKDSVRAVGRIVAAVDEKSFAHTGQDEFTAAVAGARRRQVGDGHKWSRKDSTVDITPLVAATVALWVSDSALEDAQPSIYFI